MKKERREGPGRAATALRFATKLPNARNETGLGLDTTDFALSLLVGKTVQSVRLVGNFGFARAESTGENSSTTQEIASPGSESRSVVRLGGRYTRNALRIDGGILFGLTTPDPKIGFGGGFTYVFDAFKVP